jgi:hypothetical protein
MRSSARPHSRFLGARALEGPMTGMTRGSLYLSSPAEKKKKKRRKKKKKKKKKTTTTTTTTTKNKERKKMRRRLWRERRCNARRGRGPRRRCTQTSLPASPIPRRRRSHSSGAAPRREIETSDIPPPLSLFRIFMNFPSRGARTLTYAGRRADASAQLISRIRTHYVGLTERNATDRVSPAAGSHFLAGITRHVQGHFISVNPLLDSDKIATGVIDSTGRNFFRDSS